MTFTASGITYSRLLGLFHFIHFFPEQRIPLLDTVLPYVGPHDSWTDSFMESVCKSSSLALGSGLGRVHLRDP